MSKEKTVKDNKQPHRYPYLYAVLSVVAVSVLAQFFVILDCMHPMFVMETDAVSSVMSTCSEVVAGLYGITLTGYIFFADRFQKGNDDDETMYEIVQALLIRYNHMAGAISVMCLIGIVLGEGIVLYGNNTILSPAIYRFLVDETLLFFFWTFNIILYFVMTVLDPLKVSRISAQRKSKLSDSKELGDVGQFISDYNAIEKLLLAQMEELVATVRFVPNAAGKKGKPKMMQTMETLRNYSRISVPLWRKLEKVYRYYNLAIHDPNMTVTQEMCDLAREVLMELEKKSK